MYSVYDMAKRFPVRAPGCQTFSLKDEKLIYDHFKDDVSVQDLATLCRTTRTTIYAILNRVEARIAKGEEAA